MSMSLPSEVAPARPIVAPTHPMLEPTRKARVRFATAEWLEQRRLMSTDGTSPPPPTPVPTVAETISAPATQFLASASLPTLTRLRFNNATFYDVATAPVKNSLMLYGAYVDATGKTVGFSLNLASAANTWDAATSTLTAPTPFGRLLIQQVIESDRLNYSVTVRNTSAANSGIRVTALTFSPVDGWRFTGTPKFEQSWSISGNNGPQVVRVNDGDNAIALVNTAQTPKSTTWFQQIGGGKPVDQQWWRPHVAWTAGAVGTLDAPVAAGGSRTFSLSLRFALASAPTTTLAGDSYSGAAQSNPFRINWLDRRPIGALFMHCGNGPLVGRNVNGTAAETSAYRTAALNLARTMAASLVADGAQGVIAWDIEGPDQFKQGWAYAGDPRVVPTTNKAFDGVADQFFKIFRDAGLRVGVTIRNSDLTKTADGSYIQPAPVDPVASYTAKIDYAVKRWGATLFYIDVADLNDTSALDAIQRRYPNVLLIPEVQGNTPAAYNAFTAPFRDMRLGLNGTPQYVRDVYPEAFSVIWTGDGDRVTHAEALKAAVRSGDILLGHAGNMAGSQTLARNAGVPLVRTPATAATTSTTRPAPAPTSTPRATSALFPPASLLILNSSASLFSPVRVAA